LLCRDYKAKEADRLVTRIDHGVVSLVAEFRGHERQAAEELEAVEDARRGVTLDASQAAITLGWIRAVAKDRSRSFRDGELRGPALDT
jgi:hypothetical protein